MAIIYSRNRKIGLKYGQVIARKQSGLSLLAVLLQVHISELNPG